MVTISVKSFVALVGDEDGVVLAFHGLSVEVLVMVAAALSTEPATANPITAISPSPLAPDELRPRQNEATPGAE
ncbi:uncharacterized protein N7479_010928 [Penicillium vulpinum]|nr:uncharacterized protein N7479_010928 [Penicillium vulpinum]KAJ5952515.1 hypothetical protein N7479_010928 [Penicillium vulpinum]